MILIDLPSRGESNGKNVCPTR